MRSYETWLLPWLLGLAACSTGSTSTAGPSADGGTHDATTKESGPSDGGASDTGEAPPPTGDSGPLGQCAVRPKCEACLLEAGVCCVYPNPAPPPGPENAIACNACKVDAGPLFVTLTCDNEHDCTSPKVCCIEADAYGNEHSFCAAACDPRQNQFQLCDANATSTACSPNSPCSRNNIDDWALPHCYGTCGGVGPPRDQ